MICTHISLWSKLSFLALKICLNKAPQGAPAGRQPLPCWGDSYPRAVTPILPGWMSFLGVYLNSGPPCNRSLPPGCPSFLPMRCSACNVEVLQLCAMHDQGLPPGLLHLTLKRSLSWVLQTVGVHVRWGICPWHFGVSPDLGVLGEIPAHRSGPCVGVGCRNGLGEWVPIK